MGQWRAICRILAVIELIVCTWIINFLYNNMHPLIWTWNNAAETFVMGGLIWEAMTAILMVYATRHDCPLLSVFKFCKYWQQVQIIWISIAALATVLLLVSIMMGLPYANLLDRKFATTTISGLVVLLRYSCYIAASKFKRHVKSTILTILIEDIQ
ncbi:unnamed protein product [Orchesella dallaii]|uniref:Uncharacterized protein n=1 Tax=Orchesella dallaii TaxID=48710 RepID=A0ABP1R3L0_9HEXA